MGGTSPEGKILDFHEIAAADDLVAVVGHVAAVEPVAVVFAVALLLVVAAAAEGAPAAVAAGVAAKVVVVVALSLFPTARVASGGACEGPGRPPR